MPYLFRSLIAGTDEKKEIDEGRAVLWFKQELMRVLMMHASITVRKLEESKHPLKVSVLKWAKRSVHHGNG